jgi:hypothetical protein
MLADLDLLLTAVFATADDLLPERRKNARRSVTDAEVVTLAVAQAIMDIASDREFLTVARARLCHLIPRLPKQPGYWKRRLRLAEAIEWLMAMFARDCPGYFDNIVLLDPRPRRMRTIRRDRQAFGPGAGLRASLQPQPQPLVLGNAPAPARRPGRDTESSHPRLSRSERTRRRAATV